MSVRFWIIYASLFIVGATIIAFVSGPLWGLRLDYEKGQQLQLIQLTIPVFLSYLSAAITYAISGAMFPEPTGEQGKILRTITIGVFVIFALGSLLATGMYYVSANGTLQSGRLDFENYRALLTLLLGILTASTTAVSIFLFSRRR